MAVTVEKAISQKVLLPGAGGFSSSEGFSGDGSVYQFLLEVHYPVKSHLPPYFPLG
jgi:hypothetical protein